MDSFLPPNVPGERIVARLGLISDTHMPERCAALPASLFEALNGVDLLLHAGDVGELWVLDRLSAIAPVVAVHGNDDTPQATQELPYQQLISVAGHRILLWHSHYPDRAVEIASRRDDDWLSKFARCAKRGQQVGAKIVISGHTHIPMTYQYEDVLLVNPGAIASDGAFSRQLRQTVAILFIRDDGTPFITHIDLTRPNQPYLPNIDWPAGFQAAHAQFSATIVTPDLVADVALLKKQTFSEINALRKAVLRLSHRCWSGQQPHITRADLLAEIQQDPHILTIDKARVEAVLTGTMYRQVIDDLRQAYNGMVEERDNKAVTGWKVEERQQFLSRLQAEGKRNLLEIGAGTGVHSQFFQDQGLNVICTDLSPEMVKRCRQKGLTAYVMDFLDLDFPANHFEAIFAMNCLLHVPRKDLPQVLKTLQHLLKPGGLFYLGQYGGLNREGTWPEDHHRPKRFFSYLSDTELQNAVSAFFEILDFKPIVVDREPNAHFQSMILRRS